MPKSILAAHEQAFVVRFMAELPKEVPQVVGTLSQMVVTMLQIDSQKAEDVIADITDNKVLSATSGAWGTLMEGVAKVTGGDQVRTALILAEISNHLTLLEENELLKRE